VAEGPHLQAENIAHPLIHKDRRIGNDCAITGGDVLLLTGANASGKSTLLRSLALSLLLARAGTTVPAASFRFRPQRLVTVMRVSDDLEAGRSRFQAEVRALAEAVQRAGTAGDPVLVILDEILGGTNSHERHLGTEAIITHLLDAPGPVLVSTHDLELPALAERFPGRVQLAHFADGAGEEDLSFDYRLRPGVITSTNALKVMRLAGLPV
jgi:DNA mismatch repair ATPase MutS